MKDNKTPFVLRKGVVTGISIAFGAIMGGLLSSMGQNTGEYHGMKETNENWKQAMDKVLAECKDKIEEGEKEE